VEQTLTGCQPEEQPCTEDDLQMEDNFTLVDQQECQQVQPGSIYDDIRNDTPAPQEEAAGIDVMHHKEDDKGLITGYSTQETCGTLMVDISGIGAEVPAISGDEAQHFQADVEKINNATQQQTGEELSVDPALIHGIPGLPDIHARQEEENEVQDPVAHGMQEMFVSEPHSAAVQERLLHADSLYDCDNQQEALGVDAKPSAGDEQLSDVKSHKLEDRAAEAFAKEFARYRDSAEDDDMAVEKTEGGHLESSNPSPSLTRSCEPSDAVLPGCAEAFVEGAPRPQGLTPTKVSNSTLRHVMVTAACTCVGIYCTVLTLGELAWRFGPLPEHFQ